MTDTEYKVLLEREWAYQMRFMKRIGLFLFTSVIMFSAGSYVTFKTEQFFYPNKYEQNKDETTAKAAAESSKSESNRESNKESGIEDDKEKDSRLTSTATQYDTSNETTKKVDVGRVIEAAAEEVPVITADTVYLVGKINLSDGTIEEEQEDVPTKYIGLDRLSLLEELDEYNKNPPLSELRNGFSNIELTAFSKDRVVICKYYDPDPEEEGFYLMVADHFVIVYREDKQTIYMNTDIMLENLSSELQEEIIAGKYVENEQELYNFLESYSS